MNAKRRFGFVVPRCGKGIGGGVETLMADLAKRLHARGDSVKVFTTCARDNRTWENFYPAGEVFEDGLPIERFPVDERNLDIWVPLQIRLSEGMLLSFDEQFEWLRHGVNSSGLYAAVAAEQPGYDAFFFGPYLFPITFFASLIHPRRSVLIPCLHDEHYAYVDVMRSMFQQVRGCLFNAEPEGDLARRLYGSISGSDVGMGFTPHPEEYTRNLTPYFPEKFPYVLYVGRKETGKNAQLLIDHFIAAKEGGRFPDLKLVIAGAGSFSDLHRPKALERGDIIDIGHISEEEKHRLMKHALALCQPSVNESFSIVLMESWLVGTPVIVNAQCEVTRYHAVQSGGGLFFASPEDFAGVVDAFLRNPGLRADCAAGGLRYTLTKYSWDAVLARFDAAIGALMGKHLMGDSNDTGRKSFTGQSRTEN